MLTTAAMAQSAEPAAPSAAEAALLKADDQLFEADVKHDVAAISRGFADEAIFRDFEILSRFVRTI